MSATMRARPPRPRSQPQWSVEDSRGDIESPPFTFPVHDRSSLSAASDDDDHDPRRRRVAMARLHQARNNRQRESTNALRNGSQTARTPVPTSTPLFPHSRGPLAPSRGAGNLASPTRSGSGSGSGPVHRTSSSRSRSPTRPSLTTNTSSPFVHRSTLNPDAQIFSRPSTNSSDRNRISPTSQTSPLVKRRRSSGWRLVDSGSEEEQYGYRLPGPTSRATLPAHNRSERADPLSSTPPRLATRPAPIPLVSSDHPVTSPLPPLDGDTGPPAHAVHTHTNSGLSTSTDSSAPVEIDPETGNRRFTAREKGKGRARDPTPIIVDESDTDEDVEVQDMISGVDLGHRNPDAGLADASFEILEVEKGAESREKRKRGEDDGLEDGGETEKSAVEETGQVTGHPGLVNEEDGIGSYTCPVCFSAPEQAVMTDCGHVLCARCLFDSLVAAIRRNPNPHPQVYRGRPPRGTGGRGGRGRGGATRSTQGRFTRGTAAKTLTAAEERNLPEGVHLITPEKVAQPDAWTVDTLRSAWYENQMKKYESSLEANGIERENWDTIKENDGGCPREGDLVVKEELKGLWSIDGRYHIIEGECPVCRKQLPGGYGPPGSGIGQVIPLLIRIGGI